MLARFSASNTVRFHHVMEVFFRREKPLSTGSGAVNALKLLEDFRRDLILAGLAAPDRRAPPGLFQKPSHDQRINCLLRRFPCHSSDFRHVRDGQRRICLLQSVQEIHHAELAQTRIRRLVGQGLRHDLVRSQGRKNRVVPALV